MRKDKPPLIMGRKPDIIQNLDQMPEIHSPESDFSHYPKIADEYDHYPDCQWAIIEYKSRSIKDAVDQLGDTAAKLSTIGKPFSYAFVVSIKMSHAESRIFMRRGNSLYRRSKKTPIKLRYGNVDLNVSLYYAEEIERQYQQYEGSILKWASK